MWKGLSTRAKRVLILSACCVLAACAVVAWFRWAPSRQRVDPNAAATTAAQPKQTADLPRETTVGKRQSVDKKSIEKKLPGALSDQTLRDPNKLAAPPAIIPPWRGATIATPITDNTTGETIVETKQLLPRWYEWRKEFSADARYMVVGDHLAEVDLKANPIQFNARDGGVTIEPYGFVGADVRREDSAIGGRAGIGIHIKF